MYKNNRPPCSPKRHNNKYKNYLVKYYYDYDLNKNIIYFDPYFSIIICIIFTTYFAIFLSNKMILN